MNNFPRQGSFVILLYHSIGEAAANDYLKLRVKPASFEEQMAYLYGKKYNVLSINELSGGNYQSLQTSGNVFITFDDGYLDNLEFAAPILKKYGFTATLFVTTDYLTGKIDKNNYWGEWGYLTADHLKAIVSYGFEIGSHSRSHRILPSLDGAEIRNEVSSSKKVLEDITRKNIVSFSYPHGIFNKSVKKILQEEGYLTASTSITGFNDAKSDLFELNRIEMRAGDSLDDFKNKLKGYYNWQGYFQRIRLKSKNA